MRCELLRAPAFIRAARRLLRKNRGLENDVREALTLLSAEPHHPYLRTHKLTGSLQGSWACSAGYDLRIVFSFIKYHGKDAILLETIGTHDEVY